MRDIILVRGDSMRFRSPLSFSLFPSYLLHCPATRFVRFPSCVGDQLIDGSTPLEWIGVVVVALVVVNASPLAIVLFNFSEKETQSNDKIRRFTRIYAIAQEREKKKERESERERGTAGLGNNLSLDRG